MGRTARPDDARRREILDAALQVFLEAGVEGASVEDVRRRSGASVGSLYHRFGSKERLAAAVYVDALGDYQREFTAALDRARDPAEGVRSAVRIHLRWVRDHPDRAEFLFNVVGSGVRRAGGSDLRELNAGFFGHVQAWLRRGVAAGQLRALPTDVVYALWLGPSQELARLWLARGRRGALRNESTVLADAAWRVLRHDPNEEDT
ncbi:TetR/AcrR family transcriptional regulator [Mycolicibacterium hippocampi]|uniref:TetR/AcrR family transcriptional regulator n=1 Tax=Mycolicibacterium hippocampi TaxID=659824 RepID=UPI003511ADCD